MQPAGVVRRRTGLWLTGCTLASPSADCHQVAESTQIFSVTTYRELRSTQRENIRQLKGLDLWPNVNKDDNWWRHVSFKKNNFADKTSAAERRYLRDISEVWAKGEFLCWGQATCIIAALILLELAGVCLRELKLPVFVLLASILPHKWILWMFFIKNVKQNKTLDENPWHCVPLYMTLWILKWNREHVRVLTYAVHIFNLTCKLDKAHLWELCELPSWIKLLVTTD